MLFAQSGHSQENTKRLKNDKTHPCLDVNLRDIKLAAVLRLVQRELLRVVLLVKK
ncbi:hypothetical protein [Candidatus Magnetobacterium casense]|uniref:hypothetical protein n=1 Tax=Candidatus Magnetobacterium casense TaxID=1455061 RepID=UPI0012DF07B8|nr:hypothetical protein [Candidatus Magnetobacterium casensis]